MIHRVPILHRLRLWRAKRRKASKLTCLDKLALEVLRIHMDNEEEPEQLWPYGCKQNIARHAYDMAEIMLRESTRRTGWRT